MSPSLPPRIASRILDRVSTNRVTIIIGPTGSGKSTLVPPLLQQHFDSVLCTQPRRLAVVAIATRVAQQAGCEVGDRVGYQIGNQNNSSHQRTQLLFTTAGILLEELRANGKRILERFRVVVLDECHERSPESDLVLVLMRNILRSSPRSGVKFRLVLMSATFHHDKYKRYFQDCVQEPIDTITLETADSFDAFHRNVETYYLDEIVRDYLCHDDNYQDNSLSHKHLLQEMRENPHQDLLYQNGKSLSPALVELIRDLINKLDDEDTAQTAAPFLVFAPTYRHLEQLHHALLQEHYYQLIVLHSSVDIAECLNSIQRLHHSNRRSVLLASAIADSSITVPGIACVIDTCRSLEVGWDVGSRTPTIQTVWASQSICDQRRGRTGRTGPGTSFRLVPKQHFHRHLKQWDTAQLPLSSCHNELMTLLTTSQQQQQQQMDPRELLAECLDPPDPDVVDDAVMYLQEIGACLEIPDASSYSSSSLRPTPYGRLLAAIPMTVPEAQTVVLGGTLGLLPETLTLQAILSNKPDPIEHSFADPERNHMILQTYYSPPAGADDNTGKNGSTHAFAVVAQFSAYLFWDVEWNQQIRRRLVEHKFGTQPTDAPRGVSWDWTPDIEESHLEWCRRHQINPTSVRSIATVVENTLQVLFQARFEPTFLRTNDINPLWKRQPNFLAGADIGVAGRRDMMSRIYGDRAHTVAKALTRLCRYPRGTNSQTIAQQVLDILKSPNDPPRVEEKDGDNEEEDEPQVWACVHFLKGNCIYGAGCRHSHSPDARRPPCRFYQQGTCAKGDNCIYEHEPPVTSAATTEKKSKKKKKKKKKKQQNSTSDPMAHRVPLQTTFFICGNGDIKQWYRTYAPSLLMLGEGSFEFTRYLKRNSIHPLLSTTYEPLPIARMTSTELASVDATRLHIDDRILVYAQDGGLRHFAWNFPFAGTEEDPVANEMMLLETFQSISLLMEQNQPQPPTCLLGLTLQGDQFSRWNVIGSAWKVGWKLDCWSPFRYQDFGGPDGYKPMRSNGTTFPLENAHMYVFSKRIY